MITVVSIHSVCFCLLVRSDLLIYPLFILGCSLTICIFFRRRYPMNNGKIWETPPLFPMVSFYQIASFLISLLLNLIFSLFRLCLGIDWLPPSRVFLPNEEVQSKYGVLLDYVEIEELSGHAIAFLKMTGKRTISWKCSIQLGLIFASNFWNTRL